MRWPIASGAADVPFDVPRTAGIDADHPVEEVTKEYTQLSDNSAESACPLGLLGYAR